MTATAQQQRYTAVAIALHWTIAVLIIGMLAFGFILDSMNYGPGSPKTALVQIHKSIGITILLLFMGRNPVRQLDDEAMLQAKIDRGTYPALVGTSRISLALMEPLRGMLATLANLLHPVTLLVPFGVM